MARHGSDGTLWGRSSDGALGVSRVGWRASFGCNGLWAPTYTPECDTSATQLRRMGTRVRHERNATATDGTRARRMGDGIHNAAAVSIGRHLGIEELGERIGTASPATPLPR